jgi:UDP-3-O-[3-hydroxymyristoyl] glucosamine N-acyltransferase
MKFTVAEVAALLGGVVEGDNQVILKSLGKIEEAGPGDLCFLSNPKYIPHLYETGASAVIIAQDFIPEKPVNSVLIRVSDPYSAFTQLLELASNFRKTRKGTHSQAFPRKRLLMPLPIFPKAQKFRKEQKYFQVYI